MKIAKMWMMFVTGFLFSSFFWSATKLFDNTIIMLIVFGMSIAWISAFLYANEIYRGN